MTADEVGKLIGMSRTTVLRSAHALGVPVLTAAGRPAVRADGPRSCALGATTELVGDDIFCTNPAIITRAIERGIANSSLIKLNQIGTVTETLQAMAICRQAGYRQFVSHRSGETEDHFIADLAVGTGCGHLKSGAPARGERVAKYNRLLEIAASAPTSATACPWLTKPARRPQDG